MMIIMAHSKAYGDQMVLVDDEDFERLNRFSWCVWNSRGHIAIARRGTIYMHREVLGLKRGDGRIVDHINRNTFDNRKVNLRIATKRTNNLNSRKSDEAKLVYKHRRRYRVQVEVNGVRHAWSFATEAEAMRVAHELKKRRLEEG